MWAWLTLHKPLWLAVERFEFMYPSGGADCFFSDQRGDHAITGWLELKYDEHLPTTFRIPKLRPEQPMFLSRQARHDVPSGVLMREHDVHLWHLWVAEGKQEWSSRINVGMPPTWSWDYTRFSVEGLLDVLYNEHYRRHREWTFNAPRYPDRRRSGSGEVRRDPA